MQTVWFLILSLMVTAYAVLDGFDLGVGALMPWICRSEKERSQARAAIGPVWNGNEVWLLAGGGAMVVAFPRLYASAFSGFYLALMLVLWLLILRGVGFEFRHAQKSPLWTGLWDTVFSAASAVLALLFGVAFGNVLRGVPLDADGQFQGSFALMLNPFALVGGLLAVATLSLHGAAFLAMKTEGPLQERARSWIRGLWGATLALVLALVAASPSVRPDFGANFAHAPLLILVPLVVVAALAWIPASAARKQDGALFAGTTLLIAGLLGSAVAGLYPRLLPGLAGRSAMDLTIYNASNSHSGLVAALVMNLVGMSAVLAYTYYVYKVWGGKVKDIEY